MIETRQMAERSADLEDLTDMIHKLLRIVWGEDWGTFSEEFPTDNDPEKCEMPYITYNLVRRTHQEKRTVKWSQFSKEVDPLHKGETITHYKCWFTCEVEFVIYDDTRKGANQRAREFETFMETYVGHFKKEGIAEIIFKEETAPSASVKYRQDLPYRALRYEVRIERTISVCSHDLKAVEVKLKEIDVNVELQYPSGEESAYESALTEDTPIKTHLGDNNFLELYNQNFPSQKGGN